MTSTICPTKTSVRILMRGLVQGQGVRPTIVRFATQQRIGGTVCNSSAGVEIAASGDVSNLDQFQAQLRDHFPNAEFTAAPTKDVAATRFRIIASRARDGLNTAVPLDLAICPDCVDEVRSATDWRAGYPFITCAACGPRYSILRSMPFDRAATTMDAFPMCPRCEAEYRDPQDRRFHAQTVCCPNCGPQCWVSDGHGNRIAETCDAIEVIAQRILVGDIVAAKGIGGYQLLCDASNHDAVETLRHRKARPTKPLPIMVGDIDAVRRFAHVNETEQSALQSPAAPIVLLRSVGNDHLSPQLSPNLRTIGVMLPTSSLHLMLVDRVGCPLVVTSGNTHGSPIAYQNVVAQRELATIADVFLHHDREISHPIDDSVVQCIGDQVMTIRASRGIAPMTFPTVDGNPAIATGGHQKVSVAIQNRDTIVLGPYIGDMQTESSRMRFIESVSSLGSLHQVDPASVVHDQHPDYFTTAWAEQHFPRRINVQHHHAHVAAGMLEHDLLERTVLGISFDGTGYGDDGTIWGGEVLLADASSYRRLAHLRSFRLPGGESAIRQPWRIAKSLGVQVGMQVDEIMRYPIDHGPITSSMGRLFDGVAALVLGIESVVDEAEAALRLEAVCDWDEASAYRFRLDNLTNPGSPRPASGRGAGGEGLSLFQLDWRPIVRGILTDLGKLSPGRIAMKFHRAVANLVCELAAEHSDVPCIICGGVFQNRVLMELIQHGSRQRGLDIRMPGRIPVGDGGLAIGQLVIARSLQKRSGEPCV